MANITKHQVKSRARKIIELLEDANLLLNELKGDVEEEKDNIEPYEGKCDLTEAQEERQCWLEDAYSYLDEYDLEDVINNLEEIFS